MNRESHFSDIQPATEKSGDLSRGARRVREGAAVLQKEDPGTGTARQHGFQPAGRPQIVLLQDTPAVPGDEHRVAAPPEHSLLGIEHLMSSSASRKPSESTSRPPAPSICITITCRNASAIDR
jgi:hypothetical protein